MGCLSTYSLVATLTTCRHPAKRLGSMLRSRVITYRDVLSSFTQANVSVEGQVSIARITLIHLRSHLGVDISSLQSWPTHVHRARTMTTGRPSMEIPAGVRRT